MRSAHLVDPQLRGLLADVPAFRLSAETLADVRAMAFPPSHPDDGDPVGVTVEEHRATSSDGHRVRLLLYRPVDGAATRPAYLHIHGGGYLFGSPEGSDAANRALANELGCVVVSVDYRVAPETPHPGPVEDCLAGLTWLHERAPSLGVDRARIAVGGESAGGGLAAALCLLARDRGALPVCFQHLVYPMLDDRTGIGDVHPYAGEFLWTPENNRFGWQSLLGCQPGGERVSPYAAPARALDLSGLPPTFLAVGSIDLFVEENIDYARRLIRAGVSTELHIYPGAYHAFQRVFEADVSRRFFRDSTAAMRRGLT